MDLANGHGEASLPGVVERKSPEASREPGWQWLFPMDRLWVDPGSGKVRRRRILDGQLQRVVERAVAKSGVDKPA